MARSRVRGVGGLTTKLRNFTPAMEREVGKALDVISDKVADDAAISITTGAVSGKNHVASAPGEPPNADTHELDRSIRAERIETLHYRVVADAPHAAIQELGGTVNHPSGGTFVLPERPYMRPAVELNRESGKKLLRAAVRVVAKGGKL